jgi:hypothetical protein
MMRHLFYCTGEDEEDGYPKYKIQEAVVDTASSS